ncbi:MAG: acetate kinase, partial [Dermatophilaceae bacterium]
MLVVNAGSSSLKYRVVDATTGAPTASGAVSEIGGAARHRHIGPDGEVRERAVRCPDHASALVLARDAL